MPWQQLKITTTSDSCDTLVDLLEKEGALAITFTDAKDNPIYEPEPDSMQLWEHTQITALFSDNYNFVALFEKLDQEVLNRVAYTVESLADKAWERVCMEAFQPQCFNNRLWICPSWHKLPEIKNTECALVMLDPGLAFGTGSHPTTRLCLEWLATQDLAEKILIDFGCGSGILAIAALKLGARKVYAVDIDPQALLATNDNARHNGLSSEQLFVGLPSALPLSLEADILIANILANPLITLAPLLTSYIAPKGNLVLSGLLSHQDTLVQNAYKPAIQFNNTAFLEEWARLTGTKTH